MNIYPIKSFPTVLIFAVLCTSCEFGSADNRSLCDAELRHSVVQIQGVTLSNDPGGIEYDRYKDNIRNVIERCALPLDGIKITGDTSVSELEVYVMAGLTDELHSKLILVESMDDSEKASLLLVAARYGDLEVLRDTIQSGVDVTLTDRFGNNAISETVDSPVPAEEKIEFLFNEGVDPLARSADDFSALDGAVIADDQVVIRKILSMVSPASERNQQSVAKTLELARKIDSPAESLLQNWLARP